MLEQLSESINANSLINTVGILLSLVALETVLSADNAVALAALVQHLPEEHHQQKALNWGLSGAFILRISLILMATWVIQFWQFEVAGALYLLWLTGKYFWEKFTNSESEEDETTLIPEYQSNFLWQIVPVIAVTDLAFSLDSVTTAVAISNETWLVLTGCIIGIIALRFLTDLFVKWLNTFTYLQDAAYLTILWVAIRLLFKAFLPSYLPPEWAVLFVIAMLFTWGFSKKNLPEISL